MDYLDERESERIEYCEKMNETQDKLETKINVFLEEANVYADINDKLTHFDCSINAIFDDVYFTDSYDRQKKTLNLDELYTKGVENEVEAECRLDGEIFEVMIYFNDDGIQKFKIERRC